MHFYLAVDKLWRMYIWDLAWLNWTLQKPIIVTAHANHVILEDCATPLQEWRPLLASEMLSASCRYMSGPNRSVKISHLQKTPMHLEKTDRGLGSHLHSFAQFPLSDWGNWQNLVPPVEETKRRHVRRCKNEVIPWCYLITAYGLKKKHKGQLSSLTWT